MKKINHPDRDTRRRHARRRPAATANDTLRHRRVRRHGTFPWGRQNVDSAGARDGTKPGGGAFIVDPNFLSYKTGPIEITIVAQRRDPARAAAIDLEYEYDNPADERGVHPYKKELKQIPEGDGWHTLTWRLDDAEFNGYRGFHFRFPVGPFNIQSVSVKKL